MGKWVNFLSLHYAYICTCSLLAFAAIAGHGNMPAVDAFFFGASASTESGLNTIDLKELKLYQQVVIYVIPVITNLGFINILIVVVRLYWFEQHFKNKSNKFTPAIWNSREKAADDDDIEAATAKLQPKSESRGQESCEPARKTVTIRFDEEQSRAKGSLYIPPPQLRDRGYPILESNPDAVDGQRLSIESSRGRSFDHVASSMFAVGARSRSRSRRSTRRDVAQEKDMLKLSSQVTIGPNSDFRTLSDEDREALGGVEYMALKVLLKVIVVYFFGLHLLGAICLLPWIHHSQPKYQDYLAEMGQSDTWWAFYSAQTMVNNLGFTLTPDSMLSFRDATWPMLLMTFLAFAGNTCYPIFLRFIIWSMYHIVPRNSRLRQPLNFLLQHPRRCYTLLFPSKPTWILFGILIALNTLDVILIIALDIDNPAVTEGLPLGPRILAALFQAASSRHTGTSSFNLANVNPAVQVSLLVMMYIAIFPIAMSIRSSNTYEEKSLGIYAGTGAEELNEQDTRSYLLTHMQNQLSFDLWYIFLGIFCICVAEATRLADMEDPSFNVFAIFFEVISAYGNVGLSLGYPTVNTSLSGQFSVFSKVVICAMMIRGRHRMLPYSIDRAIMLPSERETMTAKEIVRPGTSLRGGCDDDDLSKDATRHRVNRQRGDGISGSMLKLKRHVTH